MPRSAFQKHPAKKKKPRKDCTRALRLEREGIAHVWLCVGQPARTCLSGRTLPSQEHTRISTQSARCAKQRNNNNCKRGQNEKQTFMEDRNGPSTASVSPSLSKAAEKSDATLVNTSTSTHTQYKAQKRYRGASAFTEAPLPHIAPHNEWCVCGGGTSRTSTAQALFVCVSYFDNSLVAFVDCTQVVSICFMIPSISRLWSRIFRKRSSVGGLVISLI